jgi:hypothetical protein
MSPLNSSTTPRDAVGRFVELMVDDPARDRVQSFINLLQRKLTRITDPALQAMVATGLVGALTALLTAYLDARLTARREQFIAYCVDMLLSVASASMLLLPTHVGRQLSLADSTRHDRPHLGFKRWLQRMWTGLRVVGRVLRRGCASRGVFWVGR